MDIQLPQIIFQIVNFSIVAGALTYLLYKPIMKMLDERSKRIEEGQLAAQKAITEQEKIEDTKKSVRQKAEREAAQLLEKAEQAVKERRSQALADARAEAQAEIERMRKEWEAQREASLKNMKREFTDAVLAATEKVIGSSLDTKAQARLIDEEFDRLLKAI